MFENNPERRPRLRGAFCVLALSAALLLQGCGITQWETVRHLQGGVKASDAVYSLGQFIGPWNFSELGDTLRHFKGN